MDRFKNVLLFAGFGCFLFSVLLSALYPWMITDARRAEATIREVASPVSPDFKLLKDAYPVEFVAAFRNAERALTDREIALGKPDAAARAASDEAWVDAYTDALRRGRNQYISEACWHCHSQFVRPVANESVRFGKVRRPEHDNNALQRPVLWGTRRVGPDLTHEGGRHSNDWHVAHFANPRSVTPGSVMPTYKWFFRTGFVVARTIDPEVAEREGLDPKRAYNLPGLYGTKQEAEAALERVKSKLPSALEAEADRLFIREGRGPNATGLSVIAYLQWLGTWEPKAETAQ